MKRLFTILLAVLSLLSLTACGGSPTEETSQEPLVDIQPQEPEAPPEPTPEELAAQEVEDLLASLTLEEKVGQLFFVRVPDTDAVSDVSTYHLGGYILFGRDTADKTADALIQTIQSYQDAAAVDTGIPLLIGVDEEGGTVVRVSSNPHLRASKFPSPQKAYASGGMEAVLADTREKDLLLSALGFNVNLSPVADVSTNPADFMYDRTFGQDAAATADYVAQVVSQMAEDGMGSVLIGEEIDNEVETYVANNITPYVTTNPDGQSIVTTATLSEGNEERPVYVRSIEGDKAVISDNGQDRMVSVKRLSDIVEQDAGHMRRPSADQLLATRQSELDMTMHHNPKTQLPKPGLIIWNGDNAFILQGQDENGDWIAQPAAYDRETGQVTAKNGSSPAMPITENEILDLQDAIYDAQQVNVVSPENDNVASADAEITSAPPVEDAINQPTSEIETEGAIDQIAQPSNVENPSMVMREDGTPDFVSSGTDMTLDFLHDKYGDKMPRKIEVTRKSFDESLKKASDRKSVV